MGELSCRDEDSAREILSLFSLTEDGYEQKYV